MVAPRRRRRAIVAAVAIATFGAVMVVTTIRVHDAIAHPPYAEIKARCGAWQGDDLSFAPHGGESYGTGIAVHRDQHTWVGYGPPRWSSDARQTVVDGELVAQADGTTVFVAADGLRSGPLERYDGQVGIACAI